MAGRIKWGESGSKKFGVGVSKGVLYLRNSSGAYATGIAWNGLTNVQESPEGAETTKLYADNTEYGSVTSKETFGATIEAYWSPAEFDECDGQAEMESGMVLGQQERKTFGFCYRTEIQDDISESAGYRIHLVYGAKAQPSEKSHGTINESVEGETLSWTVSTTPVNVTGFKPTAHVILDSLKLSENQMKAAEDILYGKDADELAGTDAVDPRLPLPDELNTILKAIS